MIKKLFFFLFLWLIVSCAPIKEQGGFKNQSSQVSSQVAHNPLAPPSKPNNTTNNNSDDDDNDDGDDNDNNDNDDNDDNNDDDNKEEERPRGEEFEGGSETEEEGDAPVTRAFW